MLICVAGLRGMPGVAGGVEAHCEELLPRVRARLPGVRIRVFTRSCYCHPPQPQRTYRGVELAPVWALRNKHLEALLHTAAAIAFAKLQRADIVHLHAIGPGLLAPLARALGMAVVVTHHGADYRRSKWGPLARMALQQGERWALRFANRVIAVSASDAEELRRRYPALASNITHIPNGAPRLEQSASPDPGRSVLARFSLRPGEFVLSVGRLVPEKRFPDLIAAARAAGRTLVIAGEADHSGSYNARLLQHSPDVLFTGRLSRGELVELYRGCAVFVLASSHEGLPIAALEALACGAPVLLSGIPAHRELGLPASRYFRCGDVDQLARLLQTPAEKDSAFDLTKYDWERIADATAAVYLGSFAELRRDSKRAARRHNTANPSARFGRAHWGRPR